MVQYLHTFHPKKWKEINEEEKKKVHFCSKLEVEKCFSPSITIFITIRAWKVATFADFWFGFSCHTLTSCSKIAARSSFCFGTVLTFIKTALFNRTQCITVSSLCAQKPAVISDPLTRAFQLDFAVIRRDSEMKRCHHILHKIRSSGRWESNTQVSWAAILLRSNPTQTLCPHCRAVSAHHREAERRGDRKVFRCVGERQEQEDSASIHGFLRHENFSIWEEDGEV